MPKVFSPKQLEALAEIAAAIRKQERRRAIHRHASAKRYYSDLDASRESARIRSKTYRDKKKLAAKEIAESQETMALACTNSGSYTSLVVASPKPRPKSLAVLADYSSGNESD